MGAQTMLRLRGTEGAMLGLEFDILHPFEDVEPVIAELRPDRASPKPNWVVYHQAFLLDQALAGDGLVAAQPGRLRLEPYQLVPVLRAIRMSRVRLMLADGVGLGKTVQAGLILTELIARRMAHRILLVTPSGPLLEQWITEMIQRFGLRFEQVDNTRINQIRRTTELGANPFDSVPLAIASIDFLKQERVLELLERATYDVVVIDEAHHCMEVGTGSENREDSLRRRLAQTLATRCDALILATATPHDGNDRSFASLCELLDPSLVDGRGSLRTDRYRQHVVRRLKSHVLDPETGKPMFLERRVEPVPVVPNEAQHAAFMELQRGLVALVAPELKRAFRSRRFHDVLAFIALLKRSVSTARACVRTLSAVASRFATLLEEAEENQDSAKQRLRSLRELQRKIDQFGSVSAEEESEQQSLEVEEIAQKLADSERQSRTGRRSIERLSTLSAALESLLALGEAAQRQDPKLDGILSQITGIRRDEPAANVLIYTEYIDSQTALLEKLRAADIGHVISMNGDDSEDVRSAITNRFRNESGLVLVSTDAAAEGLNLHQRCHNLLHLELPFNPNRLEQRNGRIDRFGQTQEPVVRYLYLRGTFEERILLRLIAKYERQRRLLTFVPNTLGITSSDAGSEKLLAGLLEEEAALFATPAVEFTLGNGEDHTADPATRELLEEIDRSLHGFRQAAQSNTWLGNDGLNAEASLAKEAGTVRERGQLATNVDLSAFVQNAVKLEGGSVRVQDGWLDLTLPHAWLQGLDATPGLDENGRLIRLTDKIDLYATPDGREIGFLGRAHPLVRRALDRVRHLSLGRGAAGEDPRVSAIEAAVSAPEILFTFVARITSRAGREFERLLVVRSAEGTAPSVLPETENWLHAVDVANGVRTDGLWDRHFSSWGAAAMDQARSVAEPVFAPICTAIAEQLRLNANAERSRQLDWSASRAKEIIGDLTPQPLQEDMFNSPAAPQTVLADWATRTDPIERLAGFACDRSQPPRLRNEADSVIRIYRQRLDALDARAAILSAEILPVGMLMIVPRRAV
jgi:superfamily II DNA or RNA helicase